jgi:hypothetical protein
MKIGSWRKPHKTEFNNSNVRGSGGSPPELPPHPGERGVHTPDFHRIKYPKAKREGFLQSMKILFKVPVSGG